MMVEGKTDVLRSLLIWLGLFALGFGTWWSGALQGLERSRTDVFHRLAGVRCDPQHVAIVGIDEEALAARPEEPLVFWTPHLARSIEVLHEVGVKAIGVDLLLTVSPEAWLAKANLTRGEDARTFDRPFRKALGQGGTLLAAFETGPTDDELLLPNRDYWLSLPGLVNDIALANLEYDDGGVVRSFKLSSARQDAPRLTLGPMLAARAEKQPEDGSAWVLGGQSVDVDETLSTIPFCGPPGTIPEISMDKLLSKTAAKDPDVMALAGKSVLIAATYHAAQDVHPTPYVPQLMQGAEVHAQIAEALLTDRRIASLPGWFIGLLIALFAAVATALLATRQGIVQGGLATLAALLGLAAISYLAWLLDTDLPVGGMQVTLVAGWVLGLALGLRGSERRRVEIQKMFGRYVSDDVVEHLLSSGTTPDLGGEEREVTVLFSDIRSFTTLSEKLEPAAVLEMLNEWFSRTNGAILASGGIIDKYIGDAIMAVFGAPVSYPDHARRALRAADAMNREVERMRGWLNERHPGLDLPPFRIGVGVHSGKAVIGNVGSSQRMEFTTIGDTVNSASRIEGLTKEVGAVVLISREVVEAAAGGLVLGEPQSLHVKGRAEPVEVMAFHGFEHASDEPTTDGEQGEDGHEEA